MKKRALPVAEEAKFLNMHKLSFQSFREERFEMISLMLEELVQVQLHLLRLLPKGEKYQPLSPEMKQEVIKIEMQIKNGQEDGTKAKKKDRYAR